MTINDSLVGLQVCSCNHALNDNLPAGIVSTYAFVTQIFKPGVHRRAPGFLKLFLCGRLYVCVSAPEAINN